MPDKGAWAEGNGSQMLMRESVNLTIYSLKDEEYMLNISYITYLVGWVLLLMAGTMLVPGFIDLYTSQREAFVFFLTSGGLTFIGGVFILLNHFQERPNLTMKEVFILSVLTWILCIIAAVPPLMFGCMDLSLTDACFQSTSLITTTGANVMQNINQAPTGFLLWCSLLQWLGGKGMILMALIVMPFLRIGGMQIFHGESSDHPEKLLPRIPQVALQILSIYLMLTVLCSICLWALGLGWVDAVCHGMSTIATGGFSTWDDSIKHIGSLWIQVIMTIFMYIGGCAFLPLSRLWHSHPWRFFEDQQVRTYTSLVFIIAMAIGLWHFMNSQDDFTTAIVEAFFNVTSAITTTGYVSADYDIWGGLALIIFFFLPFIGGCTGSTAGGIKIFRLQVLMSIAKTQLKKLRHPHGVFFPNFNGKSITDNILSSVVAFFILFFLTYVLIAVALGFFELDFLTCLSGASSVLTNVGTGLGPIIGPSGSYRGLQDPVKWVLTIGMILGRLELLTVFILFLPSFWRR